jgi:hypothetical protein
LTQRPVLDNNTPSCPVNRDGKTRHEREKYYMGRGMGGGGASSMPMWMKVSLAVLTIALALGLAIKDSKHQRTSTPINKAPVEQAGAQG